MNRFARIVLVGLCLALLAIGGAWAAEEEEPLGIPEPDQPAPDAPLSAIYSCIADVNAAWDDCDLGVVDVTFPNDDRRAIAVVDLNEGFPWKTLVLRVEVCDPSGFVVHIGDSPTNDGFGGDYASTQHDAEAQAVTTTLTAYRSDIGGGGLSCQLGGPLPVPPGCITQDWIINQDQLTFDSNVSTGNVVDICNSAFLFDFPPYDEKDAEDPLGLYADKFYVGLNRTYYYRATRLGRGVQQACFFLSTDATVNPATVTAECGF